MMSEATERPWKAVNAEGDGDIWLVGQTGTVAHLFSDVIGDYYEAKANAELIVQAVNERDELLAKVAKLEVENRNLKMKLGQKTDHDMVNTPMF